MLVVGVAADVVVTVARFAESSSEFDTIAPTRTDMATAAAARNQ
jgi:hypothetical protein